MNFKKLNHISKIWKKRKFEKLCFPISFVCLIKNNSN